MKPLLVCATILAVAWMAFSARQENAAAARRLNAIAEHRVLLTMSASDVLQSLGNPLSASTDAAGHLTWHYPNQAVDFANGKVIAFAPVAAPITVAAQRTYAPQAGWATERGLNAYTGGSAAPAAHGGSTSSLNQPAHR